MSTTVSRNGTRVPANKLSTVVRVVDHSIAALGQALVERRELRLQIASDLLSAFHSRSCLGARKLDLAVRRGR